MTQLEPRRILVIDDEPDDRKLIRRMLLNEVARPYTVVEAGDAATGLDLVDETQIDCVIVDFFMPDMDGSEFMRRLAARFDGRIPVPILMITGEQSDSVATRVLREGAQDYLVKDAFTAGGLARAIENSIEKYSVLQELLETRAAIEMRNRKLEALREQLQEKVDELAKATQAKDQFMAVMSHEMRTPLNAIIGYADLLDLELEGSLSETQRQYIERIQVGSEHLLDLINDVLDLARAEANRIEMDIRAVDLTAILEEVTSLLQAQAQEKGIELTTAPCEVIPPVSADLHRLRQILTNLIGNAIKFTDEGGVRVSCSVPDPLTVQVRIEDTGIGIEAELLPLIFTEFYQIHGGLSREKGGSGLGLAISRKLAELMDADITAESEVGVGSVFTLTLRQAEAGAEVRSDPLDRSAGRLEVQVPQLTDAGKVAVLAFGDDERTLQELEGQVASNVRLIWTTDPDEVPELAREQKPTLVVLDISSGDGAAWRVAHSLQEVPELPNTAILLLPSIPSGASPAADASEGIDLGWLSLVPKPFTAAQLTRAISTAASGDDENVGSIRHYDVLVVDDDPDSRRVAAKFLKEADVQVREAADGENALMEMHRKPPDVVVLDLMMPVLDGFGVLAAMRADPVLARVPVVVLTAKTLTEAERRFLARTAVRVLQKGAHRLADVASLVRRAADRAQRSLPPAEVDG